jgi:hypothetical protein
VGFAGTSRAGTSVANPRPDEAKRAGGVASVGTSSKAGGRWLRQARRLSGSSDDAALLLIRFGAVAVEAPILPRAPTTADMATPT